jgi:hypothetical protein
MKIRDEIMYSKLLSRVVVVVLLLSAAKVFAIPFANPDPGLFGPDRDGNGYFSQAGVPTISLELLDIAGFEFGFFFQNDPGTLITIFDPLDADPDPGGPGSVTPIALIDFTGGFVFDIDENIVQSLFTGSTDNFGFYATLGGGTVYSDASLNPGGTDWFGAFDILAPTVPAGTFAPVFFNMSVVGAPPPPMYIAAVAFIPEPGTLLSFSLGGLMLVAIRRRRKAK